MKPKNNCSGGVAPNDPKGHLLDDNIKKFDNTHKYDQVNMLFVSLPLDLVSLCFQTWI